MIVIAYAMLGEVLSLTADDVDHDVLVWYYDADAAPGQTLHGRAWVDGVNTEVVGVEVAYYGDPIGASSDGDFAFTLPATAKSGDELDIVVKTKPEFELTSFKRVLTLTSPVMSALRRAGKAGLALAMLAVQAAVLFLLARRALRRQRVASAFWIAPVIAVGYLAFVPLALDITRLHGVWFDGLAVAAWTVAAYALADRLNRRLGLTRYAAVQLLVDLAPGDAPAGDAFRQARVAAPIRPAEDLSNAWAALGLVVERAGGDMIVSGPGGRFAVVPVPRSESFGGEPLVFRTNDPEFADLLVAAASDVLGELRFE